MTGTTSINQEAERRSLDDKLTWAGNYCKHCFLCINICPVKNLRFENDEMVSEEKCIQCELCMKYCPDFTIEVKPKEKKPKPAVKTTKSSGKAKSPAELKAKPKTSSKKEPVKK